VERDLRVCRIATGDWVRIVHELAMDPHGALEWEWFFAFGNVKTFGTVATMCL